MNYSIFFFHQSIGGLRLAIHSSQFGAASPEASLRAGELPFGLVVRVCASPSRQDSVFSLPCLGVYLWLRTTPLLRLQTLSPHSRHSPSLRSILPDFGHALATRPLNVVYFPVGPRDNSSPYPCRTSRLGRSKCDWVRNRVCRKDLTSFQCRRAWA